MKEEAADALAEHDPIGAMRTDVEVLAVEGLVDPLPRSPPHFVGTVRVDGEGVVSLSTGILHENARRLEVSCRTTWPRHRLNGTALPD